MKKILSLTGIAAVVIAAIVWLTNRGGAETSSWRFVTVERGSLEQVVAATGTLTPVTTVEVGTQASGQIAELYVDFNDEVVKGQLLARIDPTLQRQAVRESEASLERARAEVEQKQREFDRTEELHVQQGATDSEFDAAEYALKIARSNRTSAEVSLERARNNLAYTEIYSPIDGIVIQRNVDVGQTVAASLSAPILFLIAADLMQMEILASVDESDIGTIEVGQESRFTVQAYPDLTFEGSVRQVRLQSATQENVVNYTVVVAVRNPDGTLLPGMTATVEFVTAGVEDVLKVPNAALRFQPPEEMLVAFRDRMMAEMQARRAARDSAGGDSAGLPADPAGGRPGGTGMAGMVPGGGAGHSAAGGASRSTGNRLWMLDENGELTGVRVRPGITDGQYTEISGQQLEEGMQAIAGIVSGAAASATTNPFQPSSGQSGRRPPGGF
jgi:HlyD family secretion protein